MHNLFNLVVLQKYEIKKMNNRISIVSYFLIIKSFFSSELQITDSGLYIPKDIFFKITECIVPNLLTPTHPKEILYQDTQLKSYRLVCKKWRDLLDQRLNFECVMKFFIVDHGWPYTKCLVWLTTRWEHLKKFYCNLPYWFISQAKQSRGFLKKYQHLIVSRVSDFKIMEQELKACKPEGLLKLKQYARNQGFLGTENLSKALVGLYLQFQDSDNHQEQYDLLKELASSSDLTAVFSYLFNQLISRDEQWSILLLNGSKVNYRYFLQKMYSYFYNRELIYADNMSFSPIFEFFTKYRQSFICKDFTNKYFLYYLLLYSKDEFFSIQMILLLDFIKGSEKKFADYPEPDRIECINLFRKNIMGRMQKIFCETEDFLKVYFGID